MSCVCIQDDKYYNRFFCTTIRKNSARTSLSLEQFYQSYTCVHWRACVSVIIMRGIYLNSLVKGSLLSCDLFISDEVHHTYTNTHTRALHGCLNNNNYNR